MLIYERMQVMEDERWKKAKQLGFPICIRKDQAIHWILLDEHKEEKQLPQHQSMGERVTPAWLICKDIKYTPVSDKEKTAAMTSWRFNKQKVDKDEEDYETDNEVWMQTRRNNSRRTLVGRKVVWIQMCPSK